MMSFEEFAGIIRAARGRVPRAQQRAALLMAQAAARRARSYIGHPQDGWPPLSPATDERKARAGFLGGTPLLAYGHMRDSIEADAAGDIGVIGSNDPKAVYHELGNRHVPPRPFLAKAMRDTVETDLPEIAIMFYTEVFETSR